MHSEFDWKELSEQEQELSLSTDHCYARRWHDDSSLCVCVLYSEFDWKELSEQEQELSLSTDHTFCLADSHCGVGRGMLFTPFRLQSTNSAPQNAPQSITRAGQLNFAFQINLCEVAAGLQVARLDESCPRLGGPLKTQPGRTRQGAETQLKLHVGCAHCKKPGKLGPRKSPPFFKCPSQYCPLAMYPPPKAPRITLWQGAPPGANLGGKCYTAATPLVGHPPVDFWGKGHGQSLPAPGCQHVRPLCHGPGDDPEPARI